MKPKPFSALNHFTVPVAMSYLLWGSTSESALRGHRVAAMITPSGMTGNTKVLPPGKNRGAHLEFWEPQLQQLRSTVARRNGLRTSSNSAPAAAAITLTARPVRTLPSPAQILVHSPTKETSVSARPDVQVDWSFPQRRPQHRCLCEGGVAMSYAAAYSEEIW
jgi:hypothetical protein